MTLRLTHSSRSVFEPVYVYHWIKPIETFHHSGRGGQLGGQCLWRATLTIIYLERLWKPSFYNTFDVVGVFSSPTIHAERSSCVNAGLNNENIAVGPLISVTIIKLYNLTTEWSEASKSNEPWNTTHCSESEPSIQSDIAISGQSTSDVFLWFFLTICLWQLTVMAASVPCRLIGYWHLVIKTSGPSLVLLSQAVALLDAWPMALSSIQNGPQLLNQLHPTFKGITCNWM